MFGWIRNKAARERIRVFEENRRSAVFLSEVLASRLRRFRQVTATREGAPTIRASISDMEAKLSLYEKVITECPHLLTAEEAHLPLRSEVVGEQYQLNRTLRLHYEDLRRTRSASSGRHSDYSSRPFEEMFAPAAGWNNFYRDFRR